jgi:hypothetical protein
MMHGHEKSDPAIVAVKPANKAERSAAELVERRAGTEGMRTSKARTGLRARLACHGRWSAYGKSLPSHTRGGSRMRESRTYGSVRGARSNSRPYRERALLHLLTTAFGTTRT